jgi:hypothetical protein
MRSDKVLVITARGGRNRADRRDRLLFVEPANAATTSSGQQGFSTHHHVKHGIAAILVGLACLAFAWFRSGPKSQRAAT